jgi:peptidoglycan/LPS O-acetylase OafA/YrhL
MPSNDDIRALTGIRGVAALGVMAFHYWYPGWIDTSTLSGAACERGYIFVDLFFILSGFVMARAYGHHFTGAFSLTAYKRFLGRRIARVYPLYILLLAIAIALSLPFYDNFSTKYVALLGINALLMQSWFGKFSVVGTSWSLSTE